jgi:hypothetical protein
MVDSQPELVRPGFPADATAIVLVVQETVVNVPINP